MKNVQIKILGTDTWKDTEYKSMDNAIKAIRESYKLFGIIHCELRLNGKEWDNF